jgi:hypothetical protein
VCVSSSTSTIGALQLNTSGSLFAFNQIAPGASFYQRVGKKVNFTSIRFTFNIGLDNNEATQAVDVARVVIFYDRQFNGALPARSDVLQDTNAVGGIITDVFSGVNISNRDRFLILIDKRIMLGCGSTSGGTTGSPPTFGNGMTLNWPNSFSANGKHDYMIDEYRVLPNLTTQYKAESNPPVSGDIATGALIIMTYGLYAPTTENYNIPQWNIRMRYTDTGM